MAAARLIVEHLPHEATEDDVRAIFELEGEVLSVSLPADLITGQTHGVAIVEMASEAEARDAAQNLDHVLYARRRLHVKLAEGWEYADMAPPLPYGGAASAPKPAPVRPHRPERSPGR